MTAVERSAASTRSATASPATAPARATAAASAGNTSTPASNASRVAFSQVMPDEKKESATAFLIAAVAYYASLGVSVVMTDNGSCYRSACRTSTRPKLNDLGGSATAAAVRLSHLHSNRARLIQFMSHELSFA